MRLVLTSLGQAGGVAREQGGLMKLSCVTTRDTQNIKADWKEGVACDSQSAEKQKKVDIKRDFK